MGFHLLGKLKEVESTKSTTHTFHISKKTRRSHPNHLGNDPLRPTKVLMHQTSGLSLDMDKGAFGRLQTLAQKGMHASREFSPQTCACDSRICATFLGPKPR